MKGEIKEEREVNKDRSLGRICLLRECNKRQKRFYKKDKEPGWGHFEAKRRSSFEKCLVNSAEYCT
jgi:hypothetical protein